MARATLRDRLPGVAANIQRRVSTAVKHGAQAVRDEAERRAPEDQGDLKGSITVARHSPAAQRVAVEESRYGHIQEFGAEHLEAQPYLIPALSSKAKDIEDRAERALRGAY